MTVVYYPLDDTNAFQRGNNYRDSAHVQPRTAVDGG